MRKSLKTVKCLSEIKSKIAEMGGKITDEMALEIYNNHYEGDTEQAIADYMNRQLDDWQNEQDQDRKKRQIAYIKILMKKYGITVKDLK